jgi:hypothetical protein
MDQCAIPRRSAFVKHPSRLIRIEAVTSATRQRTLLGSSAVAGLHSNTLASERWAAFGDSNDAEEWYRVETELRLLFSFGVHESSRWMVERS